MMREVFRPQGRKQNGNKNYVTSFSVYTIHVSPSGGQER
jgi:hypothetical protein